ncbi:S8 family serine peptidase [Neobacillus sp. FSL H8-0543]|uniref:S8 family serine peptidase n=1 Tax=Neobacillus sp. FSL H8-0543 TaxID=2954672 RepID=UPI0031591768
MAITTQRLIVGFYPNVNKEEREEIHYNMGATLVQEIKELNAHVVSVPLENVDQYLAQYATNAKIRYVEIDRIAHATGLCRIIPNDPSFDLQWGLEKINAPEAWCRAVITPANINIAILDTGIDQDHPDLVARIARNVNFTTSPTVDDLFGHGTHVAGIAGAITNNLVNGAGTSFNSGNLWNLKVLGDDGFGLFSWIAAGIVDATNAGAHVINMSLGGADGSIMLEDAVNFAWNNGVVIVASAGNDNTNVPEFPAAYVNVISVAATDEDDQKASFSNFGDGVDVAAPGVGIYSTCPNHTNSIGCMNFGPLNGTSMASPFVAGLAALIRATFPLLSNQIIRQAIESSTDEVPGSGVLYQFGRINAEAAMIASETVL